MTAATKFLLDQLRQYVGADSTRRKSLYDHLCEKIGRTVSRGTLHKILAGDQEPKADFLIPILRWLQLKDVIKPGTKAQGLFVYQIPLFRAPSRAHKNGKKKTGKTPKNKRSGLGDVITNPTSARVGR